MTDDTRKRTIGEHVAEAVVRVQHAMRPVNAEHADARLTGWLDAFENDMRDVLAPHLAAYADHPDTPPEVADLFRTLSEPEHATQSGLLFAAVGALVYPLVSAAMAGPANVVQQHSLSALPDVALTPGEIALALVRNTPLPQSATAEAALSGVNAARLKVMQLNTGDSLPLEAALLLYRRGKLTRDRLETAIRQSRVRDEWFDSILDLQYTPPSAGEVISAAVKERLTDAEAQTRLAEAGVDPANYEWLKLANGRPYGTHEALELLNRGEITEARVREVIAQSDVNTTFTDDILKLRVYVPPVRSVVPMLRAGAITEAHARELLAMNGVQPVDVDAYIKEAAHGRTQSAKDLSRAQIVSMYEAHLIDRPTATGRLQTLGYTAADVDLMLNYADDLNTERFKRAALNRVHAAYVAHRMTAAEATAALSADAVDPAHATEYLKLWDIERGATLHRPTVAQVVGAYRRGVISAAETKARLLADGVAAVDLPIVVAVGYPPTAGTDVIDAAVNAVVNA